MLHSDFHSVESSERTGNLLLTKENVALNQIKMLRVTNIVKADFQSVKFSERAEILLFAGENVALKLNR